MIKELATGLGVTLVGETLAYFKLYGLPAGVSVSAFALVSSLLVFLGTSWLTRDRAAADLDADIRLVMSA